MNYDFARLRVSQLVRLAIVRLAIGRLASFPILYIAFFPSRETRETHTDIFARSESHFPQNSREKNCETRLAINPRVDPMLRHWPSPWWTSRLGLEVAQVAEVPRRGRGRSAHWRGDDKYIHGGRKERKGGGGLDPLTFLLPDQNF